MKWESEETFKGQHYVVKWWASGTEVMDHRLHGPGPIMTSVMWKHDAIETVK